MEIKKIAFWLLVVGVIALMMGAVVSVFTFNVDEFNKKIAECRDKINNSSCPLFNGKYSWYIKGEKTWDWDKSSSEIES
ncbi:MAG: hypothetical protein OEL87_00280 [Nanoarchaeota archaeon]|nr:hypothetical protein [Nanoarchaeota archaeon]